MATFDLAEQLSIPEAQILEYLDQNIQIDWATVTPIRFENTILVNDLQAEKIILHFNHA
jgi:hypothetical protein